MNINELNPRLRKIAQLVPPNACTADIGTDHAYIPIVLVKAGVTPRAIASDIKKGPIQRAKTNILSHGLGALVETRLGAGLETLSPSEAEVIIVAGMGGILIADILEASREIVNSAQLLILQPMTASTELRQYLCENGYEIKAEYLEAEEEKLYNIITAVPNGCCSYSTRELYLGRGIGETSPELYPRYRDAVITKLTKRACGLEKASSPQSKAELKEIQKLLEILKES